MKEGWHFHLIYDGPALQDGSINVKDLAPALLGVGDLVDEANIHITEGRTKISVRVVSDFEKGSFDIHLLLADGYDKFVDLFSGKHIQAWATLFSMIGVSGFGLFQLLKKTKGKKPKTVLEISETRTVKIEFEENETIEVDENVYKLFKNSKARRAVESIIKPIMRAGVDLVRFKHNGVNTFEANSDESDYFRANIDEANETVSDTEVIVTIITMSFKEGNKWRVSNGISTYFVSVRDDDFIDGMNKGKVGFFKNDKFQVIQRTRQWFEGNDLKACHEIIKVVKHIPGDQQVPLFKDMD